MSVAWLSDLLFRWSFVLFFFNFFVDVVVIFFNFFIIISNIFFIFIWLLFYFFKSYFYSFVNFKRTCISYVVLLYARFNSSHNTISLNEVKSKQQIVIIGEVIKPLHSDRRLNAGGIHFCVNESLLKRINQ
jgi:hypothetical protein